jgi:hypothetical protein
MPTAIDPGCLDFTQLQQLLKRHLSEIHWSMVRLYKSDILPDGTEHFFYFGKLNSALRSGSSGLAHQADVVNALDAAFELFVLAEPTTFWRGIGLSKSDLEALAPVGRKTIEPAYSSCATEEYVAERFARSNGTVGFEKVLLEIHAPSGLHVLPIVSHPDHGSNDLEFEYLLPRNCEMEVLALPVPTPGGIYRVELGARKA